MQIARLLLLVIAALSAFSGPSHATPASAYEACRLAGNDDTVRHYNPKAPDPKLKADLMRYLQSQISKPLQEADLINMVSYRCMEGKILACVVGANLPCDKISTSETNKGASEFCRINPQFDGKDVPMFATGHDARYEYQCKAGAAVIKGKTWELDARGFAKSLWKPIE
ncbi:hypothetical protein [Rhizobium oryzicola]|uniref:Uncharacterized protein n=1 Tax=Rhizobium oryzicola TaxID=1232668 RepID=A0ABT8SQL1_9HYPH|nr:hypothetical protein [Rhizobium oryzicola]MDO1580666.1 hypothetical protein [Rhizobium oryzicola]